MDGHYHQSSRPSVNANGWAHAYGDATMTTNIVDLCNRIDAVFTSTDEPDAIFRALMAVMAKHMSYVCADCRKALAHEIRARIPEMLRRANAAAAERDGAGTYSHHLSH
jgi:hypothetical protein